MPETPEVNGFVEKVSTGKGVYISKPEPTTVRAHPSGTSTVTVPSFGPKKPPKKPAQPANEFALEVHIITHTDGSYKEHKDNSTNKDPRKKYTTMTVDRKNYSGPDFLDPKIEKALPNHCVKRLQEMPSAAYLLNPNQPGQLHCTKRGKLMVMAAGNHAVTIHFGLEAHIIGMPRSVYSEIIQNDIPGPNEDPEQAEMVRSFIIPPRFTVKNSSPNTTRTINIMAAFVSPEWAWTLVDFVRLARVHVTSRDKVYTASDFDVTSPSWRTFFKCFNGGPDWYLERPLAEEQFDIWRRHVITEFRTYKEQRAAWERQVAPPAKCAISDFFPGKRKYQIKLDTTPPPKPFNRPIMKDMARNLHGAFSGLGRHCINDLLYRAAIFPGTPVHVICLDNNLFYHLKELTYKYIAQFSSERFLKQVVSVRNSVNPFDFNEKSNQDYLSLYIDVFRRSKVLVPQALYNDYVKQGLLDPNHTIGAPYVHNAKDLCKKSKKWVDVMFFGPSLKGYSIVRAKCPPEWISGDPVYVIKDIGSFGFATTIGCAEFRENIMNRTNLRLDDSSLSIGVGRRAVEKTNKRGRPRRVGYTKKDLATMRNRQGRRANESLLDPAADADIDDLSDDSASETEDEAIPVAAPPDAAPDVGQTDSGGETPWSATSLDGDGGHDGSLADLPIETPAAPLKKSLAAPSKKTPVTLPKTKKTSLAPPKKKLAAPPKKKPAAPPKKKPAAPPKKKPAAPSKKKLAAPPKKKLAAPKKIPVAPPPMKKLAVPPPKKQPALPLTKQVSSSMSSTTKVSPLSAQFHTHHRALPESSSSKRKLSDDNHEPISAENQPKMKRPRLEAAEQPKKKVKIIKVAKLNWLGRKRYKDSDVKMLVASIKRHSSVKIFLKWVEVEVEV